MEQSPEEPKWQSERGKEEARQKIARRALHDTVEFYLSAAEERLITHEGAIWILESLYPKNVEIGVSE